jgi:hypothetical protein
MTRTFNRVLLGTFALLFALAGLDVSGALAQALPTDGTVTATTCGTGTRTECGQQDILKCEWKFEIDFNILTKSFSLKTGEQSCTKIGTKTLYKDIDTVTGGTCTRTIGGGSRGTGSTGSRGSGDEESTGDETCTL